MGSGEEEEENESNVLASHIVAKLENSSNVDHSTAVSLTLSLSS